MNAPAPFAPIELTADEIEQLALVVVHVGEQHAVGPETPFHIMRRLDGVAIARLAGADGFWLLTHSKRTPA